MKPRPYGPFEYSPIINRKKLEWPKGARVALWVIPNSEFFSLAEARDKLNPAQAAFLDRLATQLKLSG